MSHAAQLDPYSKTEYIPTPEEIRAACLEIQKGWTEKERRFRIRAVPKFIPPKPEPPKPIRKPYVPVPRKLICIDCGAGFEGFHTKRCKPCKSENHRKHMRERMRAKREAVTA